jgi:biopolymer transport protein ExbB
MFDTTAITEFFGKTGPLGIVLAGLSVYGLYVSIKTRVFLFLTGREFRRFMERLHGKGRMADGSGWNLANPLINIVHNIRHAHAAHSEDLRAEVAYLFHRNFEKVQRHVTYVRLISVTAPLLGLLGTVLGMVKVFHVLAKQASPEPGLLAGGIWEALLTTVMGLCVAVPCLFFYYDLTLKLKGFRIEAIEFGYQTIKALVEQNGTAPSLENMAPAGAEETSRAPVGAKTAAIKGKAQDVL